jgi:uncharacterized protein (DUF2236 family)
MNAVTVVEQVDLEAKLALIQRNAKDAVAGLFGPSSMTWRVEREAALFLGAGRALLLQLAHPWVAAAIVDHSRTMVDPIGRFHRTFSVMFSIVFGTLDQALAAARRLHQRHAQITGTLTEGVGSFARGSPYFANELNALRWVSATLTETALIAHDLVLPPLSVTERERYYSETRICASLFGIPSAALPPDWTAFTAYKERMLASDTLTVTPAARAIAHQILINGGSRWLHVPAWYGMLTARLLPDRLRAAFGLRYGSPEHASAERTLKWIRRVYPLLPDCFRYVGPYHEARGRILGRSGPDFTTQALNRFWIGRSRLI